MEILEKQNVKKRVAYPSCDSKKVALFKEGSYVIVTYCRDCDYRAVY